MEILIGLVIVAIIVATVMMEERKPDLSHLLSLISGVSIFYIFGHKLSVNGLNGLSANDIIVLPVALFLLAAGAVRLYQEYERRKREAKRRASSPLPKR